EEDTAHGTDQRTDSCWPHRTIRSSQEGDCGDGRARGRRQVMVVGAGYGRDSEYLAALGLDLLSLPPELHQAYDLVVESMTVRALPEPERSRAIHAVPTLVAPAGAGN
ncbi:MAG: hypothetical protein M3Y26_00665, partial [Actinomycetota bacterium]|nr:hypothetical protein [Actinomycetota bacterium]